MNTRTTAIVVGVLFLIAMVASLGGGIWLETILAAPDYLVTVSASQTQVVMGVLLELVNCVAVIGIAVLLFPILKGYNEALALGYVGIRVVESVAFVAAVITPLSLISLSQEFVAAGAPDASYYQALGALLLAVRAQLAGLVAPIFFGLGALLLYYLLYQTKLVPRFISIWGFLSVVLVLAWNLLESFGIHVSIGMVLALPMILNEIFLAIWLIAKGFNTSAIASGSAE